MPIMEKRTFTTEQNLAILKEAIGADVFLAFFY